MVIPADKAIITDIVAENEFTYTPKLAGGIPLPLP